MSDVRRLVLLGTFASFCPVCPEKFEFIPRKAKSSFFLRSSSKLLYEIGCLALLVNRYTFSDAAGKESLSLPPFLPSSLPLYEHLQTRFVFCISGPFLFSLVGCDLGDWKDDLTVNDCTDYDSASGRLAKDSVVCSASCNTGKEISFVCSPMEEDSGPDGLVRVLFAPTSVFALSGR